ncbi:MAG: hypothetical protein NVS2B16_29690 [Chloroflexota bacterium]
MIFIWISIGAYPVWNGPNGTAEGMDVAMFYSAAHALQAGLNPYDTGVLHAAEISLLRHHGLAVVPQNMARVASPPLMFWGLQPLTAVPFQPLAVAWMAFMYLFAVSGFAAALRSFGVTGAYRITMVFALSPVLIFAAYSGNVDGLVCGVLGWGLLLGRRHPLSSGALVSLACVKPQVGFPLAALVVLFHTTSVRRALAGFFGSLALLVTITMLTTGPTSLAQWLESMLAFSRNVTVVPDLTSATGLYAYWSPAPLRMALSSLCLVLGIALTAVASRRWGHATLVPLARSAPLWIAWLVLTPFAHYHDFVLLALPYAALWAQGTWLVRRALIVAALVGAFAAGCLVQMDGVLAASWLVIIPAVFVSFAASRRRNGCRVSRWAGHPELQGA